MFATDYTIVYDSRTLVYCMLSPRVVNSLSEGSTTYIVVLMTLETIRVVFAPVVSLEPKYCIYFFVTVSTVR